MKILLSIIFSAILLSLTSCGSEPKKPVFEKKDSIVINNKELEKKARLFKPASFPFVVDTNLLLNVEKGDSLGAFEVKLLAATFFKHDLLQGTEYNLATFYKIDSIKAAGKYQQYCDSLDIGMTKVSTAHALNEFQLNVNTLVLVWALHSSSYEACPSSSSYRVYFTLVYKGDVKETFLLGAFDTFADPPVASQIYASSELLENGTLHIKWRQINDEDMDQPEVSVEDASYSFTIKDGSIQKLTEKREPARKEDRKKVGF